MLWRYRCLEGHGRASRGSFRFALRVALWFTLVTVGFPAVIGGDGLSPCGRSAARCGSRLAKPVPVSG
jgi:hypothetical protein